MLKEVLINDKCKLEERKNQITTELCQLKKALEENQNKSIDADDKKAIQEYLSGRITKNRCCLAIVEDRLDLVMRFLAEIKRGGIRMGPIEAMVQDIINKKVLEDFPQIQLPAVMKARITKVTPLTTEYNFDNLKINDVDAGRIFEAKINGTWFIYNLKILTKDGDIDTRFPEIPGVKSQVQIKAGDTAAIMLLYGELIPYIIGEVG